MYSKHLLNALFSARDLIAMATREAAAIHIRAFYHPDFGLLLDEALLSGMSACQRRAEAEDEAFLI